MRKFNKICAQGDVMFIRIDELPAGLVEDTSANEGSSIIVTHSETGHHHVMERENATMFVNEDNKLESFLTVHRNATLKHLRPHDTHETIAFTPGNYRVIRQREYVAEGFRRVAD